MQNVCGKYLVLLCALIVTSCEFPLEALENVASKVQLCQTASQPVLLDSFNLDSSQITFVAPSLIVGDQGTVIYGGAAYDASGYEHAITKTSTDSASSFITSDQFQVDPQSIFSKTHSYIKDSAGRLFSIHTSEDPITDRSTFIKRSLDNGLTWSIVDTYQHTSGYQSSFTDIEIADNGDIFVSGNTRDSLNINQGIVRRSQDGGNTWSTVDLYRPVADKHTNSRRLVIDGSNIYIVGVMWDANNDFIMFTRRSTDNGASWITTSTYQPEVNSPFSLLGVVANEQGHLFASGITFGGTGFTNQRGIIARSTDQGLTWSTYYSYEHSPNKDSRFQSIQVDSNDNVYISGYEVDSTDQQYGFIKVLPPNSLEPKNITRFQQEPGQNTFLSGFEFVDNELYVSGSFQTSTDLSRTAIWKFSCSL